ncbi:hypothetical protein GCM10011492_06680 [Flexivirga endophytica]|uniref:Uncharacterized protein n=1 Tax=Flexivirga endophytica TaxID=1849103 RepID=A0A916SV61_9MICO|nr:hypothetical protein [Flexivirga endophytica]GGB19502.1 hypothetical protein GCM10011492_06680 [Flexivirga endophytica]GHB36195.1 hypothetical protein GCM10008112_00930 [Flexivirga endophytica]
MSNQIQLGNLHTRAEQITAHGGTIDPEFIRVREAWSEFTQTTTALVDDLAASLLAGKTVSPEAFGLAQAEALANNQSRATVLQGVAARLYGPQKAAYDKTAKANYDTAAKAYNDAAKAFTAALGTVDPDAAPETLMHADAKVREAWAAVPVLAAQLDAAAEFVTLTGHDNGVAATDTATLGLLLDRGNVAHRAVWDAWDATSHAGRGGKWQALVQLGAKLTAPRLDQHQPIRRPKPLENRMVRRGPGYLQGDFDPETNKFVDPQLERLAKSQALAS